MKDRNPTICGIPCIRIESDAEPLPLHTARRTGVRVRTVELPRDTRGLSGTVAVHYPPRFPVRRPEYRGPVLGVSPDPGTRAKWTAAIIVGYVLAFGVAALSWGQW